MSQEIPATCDGCGKRFSIEHTISCPKVGLVLVRHDDAAKEWSARGSWALVPVRDLDYTSLTRQRATTNPLSWKGNVYYRKSALD